MICLVGFFHAILCLCQLPASPPSLLLPAPASLPLPLPFTPPPATTTSPPLATSTPPPTTHASPHPAASSPQPLLHPPHLPRRRTLKHHQPILRRHQRQAPPHLLPPLLFPDPTHLPSFSRFRQQKSQIMISDPNPSFKSSSPSLVLKSTTTTMPQITISDIILRSMISDLVLRYASNNVIGLRF